MEDDPVDLADVRLAKQSICAHFEEAPEASDTVQGIHQFWIGWSEPPPPCRVTEEALRQLLREHKVRCILLDNGQTLWCRERAASR